MSGITRASLLEKLPMGWGRGRCEPKVHERMQPRRLLETETDESSISPTQAGGVSLLPTVPTPGDTLLFVYSGQYALNNCVPCTDHNRHNTLHDLLLLQILQIICIPDLYDLYLIIPCLGQIIDRSHVTIYCCIPFRADVYS